MSKARIEEETLALTQSLRQPGPVLAETLASASIRPQRRPRRAPVERVGRYRVIRVLGEGGMGVVYSAFDDELARPVALKLLRTDASGSQTGASEARERLVREAQAMAQLSHPNVVQVYDVGQHRDEVFIAMELIRGRTLEQWLEELGPPSARLEQLDRIIEVFVEAGRGLAAAHAVGLVHRDFKPANVLVGDDGGVRVLDFGLARGDRQALSRADDMAVTELESSGSRLLDAVTRPGTLLGTPAYFSPEQMLAAPVDAASDQFSFCVALHEALFGVRPYGGETLGQLALSLREGTRVPVPASIGGAVPGWLRAVIDRGLAQAPSERWPSMDALLDALLDDPARRRRRWLGLGLGVALVGALAGAAWADEARARAGCAALGEGITAVWNDDRRLAIIEAFAVSGVGEQGRSWARIAPAVEGWAASWAAARTEACLAARAEHELAPRREACLDRQRWQLESLVQVLGEADRSMVFEAANAVAALPPVERCGDPGWLAAEPAPAPWWSLEAARAEQLRRDLAEVFVLERVADYGRSRELAAATLERARALGDDALAAEAQAKLGAMRWRTGDYAGAERDLSAAHFLAGGLDHDRVAATAALDLVAVVGVSSRREQDGRTWLRLARMHLRSMGLDPDRDPRLWFWLGQLEDSAGQLEDALAAHQRAYALRVETLGRGHPDTASSLTHLGQIHRALGDHEAALDALEQALALQIETLGDHHPAVAYSLDTIGHVLFDLHRTDEALATLERALSIEEAVLDPDHPKLATTRSNYASALYQQGCLDEAAAQFEAVLELRERTHGAEHPEVATILNNLAAVAAKQGDYEAALERMWRVLAIEEASLGPDHADSSASLANIGRWLEALGEHERALSYRERALAIEGRVYGEDHPQYAAALYRLAGVHAALGHHEQALALHRRALDIREAAGMGEDRRVASSLDAVGVELLALGQATAALEHHRRALAIREAARGVDDPGSARTLVELGAALVGLGRHAEALVDIERALVLLEADEDPALERLGRALELGAVCLDALGRGQEGVAWRERAAGLEGVRAAR